ncbi:MAG: thiosulfate oxidation carrier complex protein SoxZ [Proteobacteria bacterium]|nr:thiosulfate oxidation carrier complex protein SoxZ [Pseudomonadota bacterium]
MSSTIRLKTKTRDGVTTVRAIIRHPMETGFRIINETGELVPAHFINRVSVKHNNNIILSCDWSRAISKNPYLSFMFKGANIGDKLELAWKDNKNNTDSIETLIE